MMTLAPIVGLGVFSILPSVKSHMLHYRADSLASSAQEMSTSPSIGLLLPLPTPDHNVSQSTSNPVAHGLNLSMSLIGIPRPRCGRGLGIGLIPERCVNAIQMMDSYLKDLPREVLTVGERGTGIWDLSNPTRFLDSESKLVSLASFNVSSANMCWTC